MLISSLRRLLTSATVILLAASSGVARANGPSEGPPVFFARELVEAELLEGEAYRVSPIVHVDDFDYLFLVHSDYGDFEARGVEVLRERIDEVKAIATLEEVGQTEAFAISFGRALKSPLTSTWSVARRPVSTVAGLPGGVSRYLQGKFYQIRRGSEKVADYAGRMVDGKEEPKVETDERPLGQKVASGTRKASRRHLGFNAAVRQWARKLRVDPYSDNEPLHRELERIGWASSLGSFAFDFAMPASDVVSYVGRAQEIVWEKSPVELERMNFKILTQMGVEKDDALAYNEMANASLTEKTAIALDLQAMDGVEGRRSILDLATEAESFDEMRMLIEVIDLLATQHVQEWPLERIEIRAGMAVGIDRDGRIVLPLAMDYLHWAPSISSALAAEELKGERRLLRLSGVASPVSKRQLRLGGWELRERGLSETTSVAGASR